MSIDFREGGREREGREKGTRREGGREGEREGEGRREGGRGRGGKREGEGEREREREGEKHGLVVSCTLQPRIKPATQAHALTGNVIHNLFGVWDNAPTN